MTPLAKKRLVEMGERFSKSVTTKRTIWYYFIVSSMTRSQLQQNNLRNLLPKVATKDNSPHSYGMAFDISMIISRNNSCNEGLKSLEKVMREMQAEGKIFLCPESKCIHITVCG